MKDALVGGLDVGTTGCKFTLYTVDGEYVDSSYEEYDVKRISGQHEIEASVITDAVLSVISDCAKRQANIVGIGITSFGESFVMLDENDAPLFPIMLYTDPRGEKECVDICKAFGEKEVTEAVGVKPHSMYSLPKILWIKKNRPDIYSKAKNIMLISDYIVYILSGIKQIDYSLASRTMAFDIRKKQFCAQMLEGLGVSPRLFSKPVPTGTVAGKIKLEMAEKLSLSAETVIVSGCHDQIASAVGAGALEAGEAVDGSGTVECVTPIFEGVPSGEEFYRMGYPAVPFGAEERYVSYALSFTGGAALKWYRDNFAKALGEDAYKILDSKINDAPTGILVLPHFAGAANPYMDNGSRAAFIGITLEHKETDIYKAIMEGVAYEMRLNLESIRHSGIVPKLLYATGGGAKSSKWLQIKADILGVPIVPIAAKEVGAQGMCMMVATTLGYYESLAKAKKVFVKNGETVYPIPENKEKYDKYYKSYEKIYALVRPLIKEMGE